MDKIGVWFIMSCKRQLKHPVFLLFLLLLPAALYGVARGEQKEDGRIPIALYAEEPEFSGRVAAALCEEEGSFRFYLCGSEQELKEDVAARRAECGYVLPEELREKLDSGRYKRSILLYEAPSTVAASLSSEVVFAGLFSVYGEELLDRYVERGEIFSELDRESAGKEMAMLYEKYLWNGSTFSFRYETADSRPLEGGQMRTVFPARGIAAVFVFVTGLFAAVSLGTDEKKGLFLPLSYRKRPWCALASLAGPVALAACSSLAGVCAAGLARGAVVDFGKEAAVMAAYAAGTALYAGLLKWLVKSPAVLGSLIPFFILGSLVLCPVFFDTARWISGLEALGRWLPPFYYLRQFG